MAMSNAEKARSKRRRLREKLAKRDGSVCRICGGYLTPADIVEVDHRVPLCRGGANVEENLQLAHRSCNRAKSGRPQHSIHRILDEQDLELRMLRDQWVSQNKTIEDLMALVESQISGHCIDWNFPPSRAR